MEIILHPTLPSRILFGFHAPTAGPLANPNAAQKVVAGVVKGTFVAGGTTAVQTGAQFPIFDQDIFFNLVRNADFNDGAQQSNGTIITPVAAWTSEGPVISHQVTADKVMRVVGSGRVTQPIAFDRALGGRTFALRFRARSSANVTLTGIRLETKSGSAIFSGSRNLTTVFAEFGSVATWPAGVEEKEALLVLTGDANASIDYDWVRFNEGNSILPPDSKDPIRYEHDLAIDKPRADVVILGNPAPPQPGPVDNLWEERVVIGGTTMIASYNGGLLTHLSGVALAAVPWATTTPISVGWQSRVDGLRKTHAGLDLANFNSTTMELPQAFDNRYFNGGLYATGGQPVFGHITASVITLQTSASYPNGGGTTQTITHTTPLHLPAAPQMIVTFRTTSAPGAPTTSTTVPMRLDTVVYDKTTNQFYAVWRGVWTDFETIGVDHLVSLALS